MFSPFYWKNTGQINQLDILCWFCSLEHCSKEVDIILLRFGIARFITDQNIPFINNHNEFLPSQRIDTGQGLTSFLYCSLLTVYTLEYFLSMVLFLRKVGIIWRTSLAVSARRIMLCCPYRRRRLCYELRAKPLKLLSPLVLPSG